MQSRPSDSNSCVAAARCSSPSRIRPFRAEYIQQQFVNPLVERRKHQPFLQISKALIVRSDFDKALEQRSLIAAEPARRCAVTQLLNAGLRSISRPSRKSPANIETRVRSRSGAIVPMSFVARATSAASTKQSARSSLTLSASVSTLRRPGSSTRPLILLRHQRSSPRGSLGTPTAIRKAGFAEPGGATATDKPTAHAPCVMPEAPARRRADGSSAVRAFALRPPRPVRCQRFHGHFHAAYHVRLHAYVATLTIDGHGARFAEFRHRRCAYKPMHRRTSRPKGYR